eukprot:8600286-Pyramimonas_sp.AAC.1
MRSPGASWARATFAARATCVAALEETIPGGSLWPRECAAEIRAWSPERHREEEEEVPLLLPRVALLSLARCVDLDALRQKVGFGEGDRPRVDRVEVTLRGSAAALGLRRDGAPAEWDRSASADAPSARLLGLGPRGPRGNLR